MNHGILRTAALELQATNNDDIVKVAGIFARIKNWWRALESPLYKERVQKLNEDSAKIKYLLNILGENIEALQSAIKDSDVPSYERSLGVVKDYSFQLAKELGTLGEEANAVVDAVPEETKEIEEDSPEVEWVTSDYRKDPKIIEQLRKQLPPGFDVKLIGKQNKPMSEFSWFKQFTPDNIEITAGSEKKIFSDIVKILARSMSIEEATSIVKANIKGFIQNLKIAMLNNSFIFSYGDPKVSDQIQNRPANQMTLRMGAYNIPLPNTSFIIDAPMIKLADLMASLRPSKKLTVEWIKDLRYNPLTGTVNPTPEQIKQTSPVPEPKVEPPKTEASRKDVFQKIAFSIDHVSARKILTEAFIKVMGRPPTPNEIQAAQSIAQLESNYGQGWKGAGIGSNNWGAIQCCQPDATGKCPANSFLYEDTKPQPDGTSKKYTVCFKSYATPVDGAADLINNLYKSKKRGDLLLSAANSGSLSDFSGALYDTGYYEGHGKTKEERIGNHMKAVDSALGKITVALNEDKHMQQNNPESLSPNQQQGVLQEYDSLMQELTAMGPVEKIIRKAILQTKLPTTRVLIALDGFFPAQVRFAHILSSALRNEIDADVSIHEAGNKVELECDVLGSQAVVENVVSGLSNKLGNIFNKVNDLAIGSRSYVGLDSKFDILSAEKSEDNYRKFAFAMMERG